jgi:hypothetical protein
MRVHGQSLHHTSENHVHWSGLDTVMINSTGSGAWTSQADANFNEMTSAIILQPPCHLDVGWASFSRTIEIPLIAALGFILLSASQCFVVFLGRNIRQELRSDQL